jgi:hypothetical protein
MNMISNMGLDTHFKAPSVFKQIIERKPDLHGLQKI